jgi:hypothetical protein
MESEEKSFHLDERSDEKQQVFRMESETKSFDLEQVRSEEKSFHLDERSDR